jgi:hypothetical protein
MGEDNSLLELLEIKLGKALLPINPEDDYLNNLNSKLFSEQRIYVERENYLKTILFVCLALVTGFSIFLLIKSIFLPSKKSG